MIIHYLLASCDVEVTSHLVDSQSAAETTAVFHSWWGTIPVHSTTVLYVHSTTTVHHSTVHCSTTAYWLHHRSLKLRTDAGYARVRELGFIDFVL